MNEIPVTFHIDDSPLIGIVHQAKVAKNTGVLIVVGGPQYRVGSHRQFIQLARTLSLKGISSFRFDYRGMGDSQGDKAEFDKIDLDIGAAIDAFLLHAPELEKVVIWGLCDAASAALMYAHTDDRVTGLVLLNPWLRNTQAMGKTMVKYYYLQRLLSKAFWKKLLSGNVNVAGSVKDAKGFVKDSVSSDGIDQQSYQQRMLLGLEQFSGKSCLILSEEDLTAREFDEQTRDNKLWRKLSNQYAQVFRIKGADHTFSTKHYKQQVEEITAQFVDKL